MFDRISFALMFLFLAYLSIFEVVLNFSFSWSWGILFLFTIALCLWTKGGLIKLEVGWKGQLLIIGQRTNYFVDEGWHWAPFPFNFKTADCRQTVVKLDPLTKIATRDNVLVEVEGTIIRRILNLHKYFSVEESGIKQGLDDIWDQTIRVQIRKEDLKKVLGLHDDLAKMAYDKMGTRASNSWGIEILRVVISGIKTDPKVAEDLELEKREKLQADGQKIETQNFIERVTEMMKSGLTREQAFEQAQLALGKASKTIDAKTFNIDSNIAELLKAFSEKNHE
jgi:regulator of protease activity HflC (stomatin/prohibitin superfamily)